MLALKGFANVRRWDCENEPPQRTNSVSKFQKVSIIMINYFPTKTPSNSDAPTPNHPAGHPKRHPSKVEPVQCCSALHSRKSSCAAPSPGEVWHAAIEGHRHVQKRPGQKGRVQCCTLRVTARR